MNTAFLQAPPLIGTPAKTNERLLFILINDWTWWAWALTATLLAIGLFEFPGAFLAAMGLTIAQAMVMLIREKKWSAFPVQLRLAYLALLAISLPPPLRWLYWVPTLGTFALVTFGYCLMARLLSLLPWNRSETLSLDLLVRTFTSRPSLNRLPSRARRAGCAGGLCSIEAQVRSKAPESCLQSIQSDPRMSVPLRHV
jgi:hypothetical protein